MEVADRAVTPAQMEEAYRRYLGKVAGLGLAKRFWKTGRGGDHRSRRQGSDPRHLPAPPRPGPGRLKPQGDGLRGKGAESGPGLEVLEEALGQVGDPLHRLGRGHVKAVDDEGAVPPL